jgi:hypothetical protein
MLGALSRTPEEKTGLRCAEVIIRAMLQANPADVELWMAREYAQIDGGAVEKYSELELDITEYVR